MTSVATAYGQTTDPWSTAAGQLSAAFTGPIAKGLSLVAIVVGGLELGFGNGSHRHMGGLIFGVGLALAALLFFHGSPDEFIPRMRKCTMSHTINPVFRGLNRPLLLLGVDRRLFFFLLSASLAFFELSSALAPALMLFVVLWTGARLAQRRDPHFLRIVMTRRFTARYDPAKWSPPEEKGAKPHGFVVTAV